MKVSYPLKITLFYVLFSALWVVLTSLALKVVHVSPRIQLAIEAGKGVVFVSITGVALYFLVNRLVWMTRQVRSREYTATHDALTHLPNREAWIREVNRLFHENAESLHDSAVLLIDVNHLRGINTGIGNNAGDWVLRTLASIIRRNTRGADFLARAGADEFVVLLTGAVHKKGATLVAEKILDSFTHPLQFGEERIRASLCIGICVSPYDEFNAEKLLNAADVALREAKTKNSSGGYAIFSGELFARETTAFRIESELDEAVHADQFIMHYQPIIGAETGELRGVESLIRWQHPKRGLLSPAVFIDYAERSGLIRAMGDIVMRKTCEACADWRRSGRAPIVFSFNVSPVQLDQPELTRNLKQLIDQSGIPASALTVEITESLAMSYPKETIPRLDELRRTGVNLAIDDFGTGYSSLSYLQRLPVNHLKVDRSFVHQMEADPAGVEIVKAIIALAHSLGHGVVAEGVETERQRQLCREMGCDFLQGYLFARPMPFEELLARYPAV